MSGASVTVGVVEAVNADGTVSVRVRGGLVSSLPCDPSYTPRAVGDRVEVRLTGGIGFVLGKRSGPLPTAAEAPWRHTLADAAPGGGFVEAASVWVDPVTREVRYVRSVPAPAATTGSVTKALYRMATYRDGAMVGDNRAEQGTWGGYGPHTGLFVYGPGAWSALAGKTITRVRVTLHRRSAGGIIAAVPIYLGRHSHVTLPASAGPGSLAEVEARTSLARNQTATIDLPISFGERLRDGTAAGFGIYHGSVNAELDLATVRVDWSS